MNRGVSMSDLINEIKRKKEMQQDRLVPSSLMQMADGGEMEVADHYLRPMEVAHGNIAALSGIPMPYYRKLQSVPALLAQNVNHWWPQEGTRFVRTYEMTEMRCILSDKYQPLENYDLAEALVPHLYEGRDRFRVQSANLTERRLSLQFIDTQLEASIRTHNRSVGDVVNGGFHISNSEVGEGAVDLSMFLFVLSCKNGAVREHALRKIHIGKQVGNGHVEVYTDSTRRKAIELFRSQVKDVLNWGFDKEKFADEVAKYQLAADSTFKPSDAPKVIKDVTAKYGMTQTEGKTILDNLMESTDFSTWGLANAITRMAHDETIDVDKAIDYEKIGGKILG